MILCVVNDAPSVLIAEKRRLMISKKEIFDLVQDEYSLIGEYQSTNKPVLIKHNICQKEFSMRRTNFLKGNWCPYCAKKHKKNTKEFKDEVFTLVGDEYFVLSEYKRTLESVIFRHNICNSQFKMRPNDFLNSGQRCPYAHIAPLQKVKKLLDIF